MHAELTGFLHQHCPVCDERQLVLLGWMVAGLLLSQTVCFDQWNRSIPLNRYLPAIWQRRCRRWLGKSRIDAESLYGPLVLWAMQQWQQPGLASGTRRHGDLEPLLRLRCVRQSSSQHKESGLSTP
jgi:hypothetical protein